MNKILRWINDNLIGLAIAWFGISISWAGSHSDSPFGSDIIRQILVLTRYLSVLIVVFQFNKLKLRNLFLFILPFLLMLLSQIHQYPNANLPLGSINTICLMLFALISADQIHVAFKILKWFMAATGALALFALVSFVLNLPVPYSIIDYYITTHGELYLDYGFAYIHINGDALRLCGLFNEPGYYGTFAALVLIADKMNLKKIANITILVAGIFTFSFAFFVLIILYYIFYSFRISWKSAFVLCVLLAIPFVVLPNLKIENQQVQQTVDRFTFTEGGKFEGDNRTTADFDKYYDSEMQNLSVMTIGVGSGVLQAKNIGGVLSIRTFILEYGYLGFLFFYGSLLLICFYTIKENNNIDMRFYAFIFLILYFLSQYQRPNLFNCNYFILLFGGIYNLLKPQKDIFQMP